MRGQSRTMLVSLFKETHQWRLWVTCSDHRCWVLPPALEKDRNRFKRPNFWSDSSLLDCLNRVIPGWCCLQLNLSSSNSELRMPTQFPAPNDLHYIHTISLSLRTERDGVQIKVVEAEPHVSNPVILLPEGPQTAGRTPDDITRT